MHIFSHVWGHNTIWHTICLSTASDNACILLVMVYGVGIYAVGLYACRWHGYNTQEKFVTLDQLFMRHAGSLSRFSQLAGE